MSSRSSWRLPFIHPSFFSRVFFEKRAVTTALRSMTVPFLSPDIGRSFNIYNGQKYIPVVYKKEMAGFKLGSFALTKVIGYRSKKAKKVQKRARKGSSTSSDKLGD
jgi:small subunit ribosomal protein S19